MHQTKNAMKTILSDLREKDFMTIIDFDDAVKVWTDSDGNEVFPATRSRVADAMDYVDGLVADKGTNINDALLKALEIINKIKTNRMYDRNRLGNGIDETQYMIIFLTDGHVSYEFKKLYINTYIIKSLIKLKSTQKKTI